MNYLKITKYIYLIFGFVMLGVAIMDWRAGENAFLPALFSGLAFFMYFFRSRFQGRFEDKNRQNRP